MSLKKYKEKRSFGETPEPVGKKKASSPKLVFVVQRHKASHLHYDFRIEMEGVLKSWAVPKGPSMNPADKRLAMMVEDHPYDYKDFKGVIPEGNYGAGIVEIWDHGEVTDIEGSGKRLSEEHLLEGLEKGSLKFRLKGRKLKGEFALVHTKGRGENAWLLIKHDDEYAVHEHYDSEEHTAARSPINKWLEEHQHPSSHNHNHNHTPKKTPAKKAVKKNYLPEAGSEERKLAHYIKPMLAKDGDEPFDDEDWVFEIKWDGYRAIAEVGGKELRLYSRNGLSFLSRYPIVADELQKMDIPAVLDGEIVVLNKNGDPDFQKLQLYGQEPDYPICYYVFDVLSIEGKDVTELTLLQRKELLQKLLPKSDVIKYSDHVVGKGKEFFKALHKKHMEGMMAKRADSQYTSGTRSSDWLKIKAHKTEEVLIAGYTEPTGNRKYFGALILAMKKDGGYQFVGHVGTGFNEELLRDLYEKLQKLRTDESPFDEKVMSRTPVTWVKPKLIAEVKYTEWTKDESLRHPVFLHLREDKNVEEITMKNVAEKEAGTTGTGRKGKANFTNLDKVYFPQEGITKGDVIEYYQQVAKYILPYLKNRPESLYRNPNGIKGESFFQKDAGGDAPDWVETIPLYSDSAHKEINYIICNNASTLGYLNNLGCIELNPWNSVIDSLDNPDYLIIDIDPSEKNSFEQVVEAALVFHDILEGAGATNLCKTSGATGLHIYVPLKRRYDYEQAKEFAHLLCVMANEQLPDFTTLERNLQKRGKNKIYLDYLQNRKGQTISCAYSLRPREGAPVSTPLEWKEVKKGLDPLKFNIRTIHKRLEKLGDLFRPVLGKGVDIAKCLKVLNG